MLLVSGEKKETSLSGETFYGQELKCSLLSARFTFAAETHKHTERLEQCLHSPAVPVVLSEESEETRCKREDCWCR